MYDKVVLTKSCSVNSPYIQSVAGLHLGRARACSICSRSRFLSLLSVFYAVSVPHSVRQLEIIEMLLTGSFIINNKLN